MISDLLQDLEQIRFSLLMSSEHESRERFAEAAEELESALERYHQVGPLLEEHLRRVVLEAKVRGQRSWFEDADEVIDIGESDDFFVFAEERIAGGVFRPDPGCLAEVHQQVRNGATEVSVRGWFEKDGDQQEAELFFRLYRPDGADEPGIWLADELVVEG